MSKVLERSPLSGTTPTSSASSPESKKHEKTVPHYLRASTGSCHDLCKYGHKKPSEELRFSGGRRKKLHTQLNDLTLHRSAILDRSKDVRTRSLSLAKSSISLGEAEHVEPKITSANRKGVASNEHLVLRTASSADGKKLNSDGRKKHSMVAQKAPTNLRNSDGVPKFDQKATVPAKADIFSANEHLVLRTSSADGKKLSSDGRKKHSMVAHKAPTNLRNSDGASKFDQKATVIAKADIFSAKLKSQEKTTTTTTKHFSSSTEKTVPEKSRSVDKVTTVRQSLLKRPSSSPTNLNSIKHVPVLSQASSHQLPSKDKITLKGKVTSSPATTTRVRTKPGRSPTKSSNSNINEKESLDMSRSPLSVEPKLTASVEAQGDNVQVTGYYVESRLAELSSDAMDCVDNCGPAPKETTKSVSKDDGVRSTENSELIVGEALLEGTTAIELQKSLNGQEVNAVLGEYYPEHKLQEHNVVHDRTSKDEDSQTDGAVVYRLSEQLISVENADVYDTVLTENISKFEDEQLKVNASVESLVAEGEEEVGVHEDIEKSPEIVALDENHAEEPESFLDFASRDTGENVKADEFFASRDAGEEEMGVHKDIYKSPEIVALDEKHAQEPESCLDFASRDAGENVKADEILDGRMNSSASHCLSISDTSSDGGLLEEPKSILIEPSDSAVNELANVSNENTFRQDGLKSGIDVPQSPEELSDDEFYEEYDFEFSDSDEYGPEDEEAITDTHRDESLKAGGEQRPRRISMLGLDDASITPYKLKFKRGKIVELPSDCSGPRRLKFRRKATNEVSDHESQPARRIYKRNIRNNAVPSNPNMESPGMKLRHQDAQEKKDAQGLFNNVIEETASKLVESRKSKVKALVGAFETVISLQDGKPTSSTHAGNSQDLVQNDEGEAPEEAE